MKLEIFILKKKKERRLGKRMMFDGIKGSSIHTGDTRIAAFINRKIKWMHRIKKNADRKLVKSDDTAINHGPSERH